MGSGNHLLCSIAVVVKFKNYRFTKFFAHRNGLPYSVVSAINSSSFTNCSQIVVTAKGRHQFNDSTHSHFSIS